MPDSATTRERMLERAIEVIAEQGEAGVRVWDIAGDCGVTGPTLYRAFGSREGLVVAAQAERYRRSYLFGAEDITTMLDDVHSEQEFRDTIDRVAELVLSDERTEPRRDRLNVLGSALARPELLTAIVAVEDAMRAGLVRAMTRARSNGWTRPDLDPHLFTAWYVSMVNARVFVELPGDQPERADWDRLTRRALLTELFG